MTQNLTGSQFLAFVNVRKHHNSPVLGVEIFGSVEWHDGKLGLAGVMAKITELVELQTQEFEIVEGIRITLCKK